MEQTLPLPTLFLIGISSFLKNYWWAMLGGVLVVVMLFRMFINTVRGRSLWDLVKLRTPIIGPVAQKIILARFASTLASLNHSGVEFMVAMRIVRTLVNNVRIAEVVDAAMEHVQRGQSMTVALAASPWFPPMFVQMIAVGEQSGSLEVMLNKVAEAYERDVETAVKGMTSLLEPMMITAMGMAVGFIVISILPIFGDESDDSLTAGPAAMAYLLPGESLRFFCFRLTICLYLSAYPEACIRRNPQAPLSLEGD
jgi:general secretion pathway protein F